MWDDQKEAQSIMQERSNLENSLSIFSKLKNEFDEISELLDLYAKEDQTSEEFEEDILLSLTNLSEKADLALMESMLSGEADSNSA
ncbi:MAG: PCRF domain-containing protein, partial [Pseudomonadota bacterium]|nr:PCRF domain-containing protein [Pseudomonadota bacterium]